MIYVVIVLVFQAREMRKGVPWKEALGLPSVAHPQREPASDRDNGASTQQSDA